MKRQCIVLLLAMVSCGMSGSYSLAQDAQAKTGQQTWNQQTAKGPNGGTLQVVGSLKIETLVKDNGILFLITGPDEQMLRTSGAAGTLKLKIEGKPKEYSLKLQALKKNGVGAAINMAKLKGKKLDMEVVINDVKDQPIKFRTTAMLDDAPSDTLLVSLQKTCPVTGKSLGSMGAPPKIMVQGKPLFVCCEPCSSKIQANPKEYLAKYYGAKGKELRPGVFDATLADVEAIAAQKKCPVMDEELGGMGTPQKVNVQGKAVYICCVGCAKKLLAEPKKYLAMLAEQGVEPPDFE